VGLNYSGGDSPQRIRAAAVSLHWFDVLGAKPFLGRSFRSEEDQPGANHVAVLSFDLWKRMFGAQSTAVERVVELDRKPYRIVGVMPANFRWPSQAEMWIPLGLSNKAFDGSRRFDEFYPTIARLQPGVTLAQCRQFMKRLTARAKASDKQLAKYMDESQWSMVVEPYTELISGDLRVPLFVLSASVGLVLLIACSNIAGLMLVRGSRRSRELAVRKALGASTADLVSHAVAEVVLLAGAGTALGLLSISPFLKMLLWMAPVRFTSGLVIEPDTYVLLFTIFAGALSALFFGIVPAWQVSRFGETYASLKDGGRSETTSVNRQRIRNALVAGQIALALVLLLGTGLLFASLHRLRSTNLGFDPAHVMTAAIHLPAAAYQDEQKQAALFTSVVDELKRSPGVVTAAAAEPVPFNGDHWTGSFEVQGRPELPGNPGPHGYRSFVSPSYFQAMGIRLREGRFFTDADRQGSQPVVIVDANLARTYWPGEDPVGKKIRNVSSDPWATVVGVVNHVRAYNFSLGDTRGIYYKPVYQQPLSYMNFVVRTAGDPEPLAALINRAVHKFDPTEAVFDIATPRQRISKALGPQQFVVDLLMAFACAAIALASFGLYSVISFTAGQRRKEIGIRCALGASRIQILFMIAGQGLRLILIGIGAGSAITFALLKVAAAHLENVWLEPAMFCLATLILLAIAFGATAIPAWRSSSLDAISALRNE